MAAIKELICSETDGTISFGDYTLTEKTKRSDFEHKGDVYKVKTYCDITKLEKNGIFVYESVPGTTVRNLHESDMMMEFEVEGNGNTQITVALENEKEYKTFIDGINAGTVKTNLGGKATLSVELGNGGTSKVRIVQA
ncbi:MAG: endosialidase [Lachnospiraceae bacterium]|nr:endosialidase [Lachnospiraceae bacterium]